MSTRSFAIIEIRSEIRVLSMIANSFPPRKGRTAAPGFTLVSLATLVTHYRHRQWVDVPLGSL
jgi:hypothetical protein